MESDGWTIMALLRLCDPRISIESDRDFTAFWTEARILIDQFLQRHLIPRPVSLVASH
jgi:hypothetical protein